MKSPKQLLLAPEFNSQLVKTRHSPANAKNEKLFKKALLPELRAPEKHKYRKVLLYSCP